jgi:MSHA biogenesis protein MshK
MTRLIGWCLGVVLAGMAAAQTAPLADPTRPPGAGAESGAEAAAPAGARLQSVLISPTRRVAVIDGRAVALGGRIGDATLETVTENAAVLRYADRRETLWLMPGVDKRERRSAAAAREEGTPR